MAGIPPCKKARQTINNITKHKNNATITLAPKTATNPTIGREAQWRGEKDGGHSPLPVRTSWVSQFTQSTGSRGVFFSQTYFEGVIFVSQRKYRRSVTKLARPAF